MSPISNENREIARRAREVCTCAERMFTWFSDSTRVTSYSRDLRSSASTWISTRNREDRVGAHATSLTRSSPSGTTFMFAQSLRCTEIPEPRVTKPTISSGGTGVQHRAIFT